MLADALRDIARTHEGIRAVLLVGLDGMIVAGAGERDDPSLELIAASHAQIVKKVTRMTREADLGAPTEIVIACPGATLVFRAVTEEYVLVVALRPDGSLGRTRFELRKAARRIVPELES